MIGDVTSSALHAALSGLAQRQRVSADNIANIQTPGFLAGRVDFETDLKGALRDGTTPTASGGTVARSLEPTNTNGNNVSLDAETVMATETGLRYQLAVAEELVEQIVQSRRQRDVAARMSYGPARPVASFVDRAL